MERKSWAWLPVLLGVLVLGVALFFACAKSDSSDDDAGDDAADDAGDDAADDSGDDAGDDAADDTGDDSGDDTGFDATWTDTATGLIWQNGYAKDQVEYTWADAQTYCAGLSWGGYAAGWRLPQVWELRSLLRGCAATVTGGSCGVTQSCVNDSGCWSNDCQGCAGMSGPGPHGEYWPPEVTGYCQFETGFGCLYWALTTVPDLGDWAWRIGFDTGQISFQSTFAPANQMFARCVHDAPSRAR